MIGVAVVNASETPSSLSSSAVAADTDADAGQSAPIGQEPESQVDVERLIDDMARLIVKREDPDAEDARTMSDGSRCHLTLSRAHNEGKMMDNEPAQYIDTLHLTAHPDIGLRWVLARDVDGGTVLYDEPPLVYVSVFEDTPDNPLNKRTARLLLPPRPKRAATMQRLYQGEPELVALASKLIEAESGDGDKDGGENGDKFSPSPEWTLTYLFLTRNEPHEAFKHINQLPQMGNYARSEQLRRFLETRGDRLAECKALRVQVEDPDLAMDERMAAAGRLKQMEEALREDEVRHRVDLAYIEAVMRGSVRRGRVYAVDDILRVFGTIYRNSLTMRTSLSKSVFGVALVPGASHFRHACEPTCTATFDEGGRLRIEAAGPLRAGTVLTIDRLLNEGMFRCVATAPTWVRRAADLRLGFACPCEQCLRALNWLRSVCAGRTDNRSGEADAPPAPSDEVVAAVVRAVDMTWRDPEPDPYSAAGFASLDTQSRSVLFEGPMLLTRVVNPAEVVVSLGHNVLIAEFTKAERTLRGYMLARFTLEASTRVPRVLILRFGSDETQRLVQAAGAYIKDGGTNLLRAKLAEQGAPEELIERRTRMHVARAHYMWMAAEFAPRASKATVDASSAQQVIERVRREFEGDERAREFFRRTLNHLIVAAAQSTDETYAVAWSTAADWMRFEMLQSRIVALAIQAVQNDGAPATPDEAKEEAE